jgi:hypothetical protein
VAVDDAGVVELLTEVDLPTPSVIDAAAVDSLRWEVDIDVDGHQLLPRAALGGTRLLADRDRLAFAEQLRVGVDGVTAHSHSQAIVLAGSPLPLRLSRPRLTLPGAAGILRSIADAQHVSLQPSAAGRRAATALALWPDLSTGAADLRPPVRNLLDAFNPPRNFAGGPCGAGIAVHGQGYLSFGQAARAPNLPRLDTRTIFDRLLIAGVLRRLAFRIRAFRLLRMRWFDPARTPGIADLAAGYTYGAIWAAFSLALGEIPANVFAPSLASEERSRGPFCHTPVAVTAGCGVQAGNAEWLSRVAKDAQQACLRRIVAEGHRYGTLSEVDVPHRWSCPVYRRSCHHRRAPSGQIGAPLGGYWLD